MLPEIFVHIRQFLGVTQENKREFFVNALFLAVMQLPTIKLSDK